jgi:hypothetical protein
MTLDELLSTTPVVVDVSDDPVTGLKRKTRMREFIWNPDDKIVVIRTETRYYENVGGEYGNRLDLQRLQPLNKDLVAGQFNFVDSNGNVVSAENRQEGVEYITEYEFYEQAVSNPIVLVDAIKNAILLADASGRLDE